MASRFLFWTVCFISILVVPTWASVLAIDFGTDWIKASLLKPGVPFDVLLNKDSKRKIHSSVGWNREDRLFGTDAYNIATRFPRDSLSGLKHLLGVKYHPPNLEFYKQISQAVTRRSERNTVLFERPSTNRDSERWSVEELIAMELAYVRELAREASGGDVNEVIVTVPGWFSQDQRLSMLDAIEIAGMKSVGLINDGSAVAINYAMTRSFPDKEYHIIYDAGAGSVRATLASFHSPHAKSDDGKKKKVSRSIKTPTKESVEIEILAVGYDQRASGNELTRRLRDSLVKKFEEKHGSGIVEDGRAMARLWKEAERVKSILSANADASTTVESLYNDIDFKTKTTRQEFERNIADLRSWFTHPIQQTLGLSGINWENITSVILMGGHSRVPMVQSSVRDMVGESKISQNVNTDESAVLGAAFYGASTSPNFKTKKITLQDIAVRGIAVTYEMNGGRKSHSVFTATEKTNSKKTLGIKRNKDTSLRFFYETPNVGVGDDIAIVDITDIAPALQNLTDRGTETPVLKFTVWLDESGILKVDEVFAWGEIPKSEEPEDESLTGRLKNFFGGASSSSPSSEMSSPTDPSATSSVDLPAKTPSFSKSKVATVDPRTDLKNKIHVPYSVRYITVPALSAADRAASRAKLIALDAKERGQRNQAEACNLLEAYIYRLRDLLSEDESWTSAQVSFKEFSTDNEREAIRDLLDDTSQWVNGEEANTVGTAILTAKRRALEALEAPIQQRQKEYGALSDAIASANKAVETSRQFLRQALFDLFGAISSHHGEKNPNQAVVKEEDDLPLPWTQEEIDEAKTKVDELDEYVKEVSEEQKLPKSEDRSFKAGDLVKKTSEVNRDIIRLAKRKVSSKKPKSSDSTASPSTPTFANTSESIPEQSTSTSTSPFEKATHTRDEL